MAFYQEGNALVYQYDSETLRIEPWGENSLRVRASKVAPMPQRDWALTQAVSHSAQVTLGEREASITNGQITATLTAGGWLKFFNAQGKELLREYSRNRKDLFGPTCSALEVEAREFRPIPSGEYQLTARFESLDTQERIYGMGQYQQPYLNLKGTDLELAQRNSQASVPFFLSSRGYGFLWNNPAVGRAIFGKNITSFQAVATDILDYWVTAGDTPAQMEEQYAAVAGTVPMMPDFAMGFWQCKLRYQTQEELLSIAREYKKRGLPISVIVVDFFHWPLQGDWKFDPTYWPDPDAMIAQLKEMGIELMVSIWPTVDKRNPRYREMLEKGLLIRTDRGVRVAMEFQGSTVHYDATNPAARDYVWDIAKENYYDKGVRIFWLDEAEPEYTAYDFDNYRYYLGPNTKVGNSYPLFYAKTFFDGMQAQGQENIINLLRCAWAGSQKYGALVWSGDIHSSFESFRNQFAAGLNMGIAGIPWWTTDIGGFHGGDPTDPAFQELLARWFQYGAFCPVMRLHGDRYPQQPQQGTTGGATYSEIARQRGVVLWGGGLRNLQEVHVPAGAAAALHQGADGRRPRKGHPGDAPAVLRLPRGQRRLGLRGRLPLWPQPAGGPGDGGGPAPAQRVPAAGAQWTHVWSGETYEGGQTVTVAAPLEEIPVSPGKRACCRCSRKKSKVRSASAVNSRPGAAAERRACAGEKRTCAPRAERSERKVFCGTSAGRTRFLFKKASTLPLTLWASAREKLGKQRSVFPGRRSAEKLGLAEPSPSCQRHDTLACRLG